ILPTVACVQMFSLAPSARPRPLAIPVYCSFYACPGAVVDIVCVPRDRVSGEQCKWVLWPAKGVLVLEARVGPEWGTVTLEVTEEQAARLERAQALGVLRTFPRRMPAFRTVKTTVVRVGQDE